MPFRALRFDAAVAGDLATLTSPPYDVIDADGVSALEASNDHNVVRLILPRDPVDGSGDTGQDRYALARGTLETWRGEGALRPDPAAALYVYEQADPAGGHAQRGLLGALALTPPEDGVVLPHENTMAGPVSDRLALYNAVDADLEPIFLVYDGGGAASQAVAEAEQAPPLVDVVLPDGLRHRLWALTDEAQLADIAADLHDRKALIADGHHRYATYLQRQAERSDAWKALDVSVLHGYVVPALWHLPDTVDTVGYEHDVDAAVAAATRTRGTAVLLNPTPVAAVAAVAGGGERMPRKSTLFTPKPRTGLVIRDYRDA
jgi:uncharacterized protein (DUF1015 family)